MKRRQIKTTYPCCGKKARFQIIDLIPIQKFDRKCKDCELEYEITITTPVKRKRIIIDMVTWD